MFAPAGIKHNCKEAHQNTYGVEECSECAWRQERDEEEGHKDDVEDVGLPAFEGAIVKEDLKIFKI